VPAKLLHHLSAVRRKNVLHPCVVHALNVRREVQRVARWRRRIAGTSSLFEILPDWAGVNISGRTRVGSGADAFIFGLGQS
jgi:hypothetical protein